MISGISSKLMRLSFQSAQVELKIASRINPEALRRDLRLSFQSAKAELKITSRINPEALRRYLRLYFQWLKANWKWKVELIPLRRRKAYGGRWRALTRDPMITQRY